jgi:hypothetical protein
MMVVGSEAATFYPPKIIHSSHIVVGFSVVGARSPLTGESGNYRDPTMLRLAVVSHERRSPATRYCPWIADEPRAHPSNTRMVTACG